MPSKEIYDKHADQYEQLVSFEDCQHNLAPALNRIRLLDGLDVVELGAGTGRLTCLIAPQVKSVLAFDASAPMLQVAKAKLERGGSHHCHAAAADHRQLPLADASADMILAGWTIAQMVAWNLETWQAEVESVLAEIRRVLRPGGTVVIIETLGTGHAAPYRPEKLAPYYSWLEERGMASTWIRTDFQFESLAQAGSLIGFFSGIEFAQQVIQEHGATVPECTGIWWLNV
jgi:ubiquinone/menaquinone biosynthesis C-methylase UbiE